MRFFVISATLATFLACTGQGDEAQDTRTWKCFGDSSSCACSPVRPRSDSASSRPEVKRCDAYDCCLFTENESDPMEADCECQNGGNDCQAEANSRPGTIVVNQCPPEDEDHEPPAAYAATGENCTESYLDSEELDGCAPGTICQPNESGVQTCREGSQQEIEWATACEAVADSDELLFSDVEILTPELTTSEGTFSFPDAGRMSAGVGPNGCLNDLDLTADLAGNSRCSIQIDVSVVGDEFVTNSVYVSLADCPGNESGFNLAFESDPEPSLVDFSFTGLSCVEYQDTYCVSGEFEFLIHGTVGTASPITFVNQRLAATGTICGARVAGTCPLRDQ